MVSPVFGVQSLNVCFVDSKASVREARLDPCQSKDEFLPIEPELLQE